MDEILRDINLTKKEKIEKIRKCIENCYDTIIPEGNEEELLDDLQELVKLINSEEDN